jgi:hypothetical protein
MNGTCIKVGSKDIVNVSIIEKDGEKFIQAAEVNRLLNYSGTIYGSKTIDGHFGGSKTRKLISVEEAKKAVQNSKIEESEKERISRILSDVVPVPPVKSDLRKLLEQVIDQDSTATKLAKILECKDEELIGKVEALHSIISSLHTDVVSLKEEKERLLKERNAVLFQLDITGNKYSTLCSEVTNLKKSLNTILDLNIGKELSNVVQNSMV